METYFDAEAQAEAARMLALGDLIAILAKAGITLEEYLGCPSTPTLSEARRRPPWLRVIDGGRRT